MGWLNESALIVHQWLDKMWRCLETILPFPQCCSFNSSLLRRWPDDYLLQMKPLKNPHREFFFLHVAPSHDYQMSNSWIACLGIHSFPPNSVHPYPVLFTSNLRNPVPSRQAGSLVLLGTLVGLSPFFPRRPLCSKTKAAFYLLPTKPYLDLF